MSESDKKQLFEISRKQHVRTNPHHPEYWGSIHNMPNVYVAEMVCDWSARSHENGTSIIDWIKNIATKKFDMTVQSKVYKQIKYYIDMIVANGYNK